MAEWRALEGQMRTRMAQMTAEIYGEHYGPLTPAERHYAHLTQYRYWFTGPQRLH